MGRFIDCQTAIVPWGVKAKFRRAKVGLLRKGSNIYIAIFFNSNDHIKLQLQPNFVEVLPASIRFTDLEKDLFIRKASDEQRYETMIREIKVILKRDKLRQNGKGHIFDQFISDIPPLAAFNPKDLTPARLSARLIGCNQQLVQTKGTLYSADSNDGIQQQITAKDANKLSSSSALESSSAQRLVNNRLRCINITGFELVPKELWLRNRLQQLTITDCNLTKIPKELETFSSTLTLLDLSNNRIDKVARTFCCKMNNLQVLDLSKNRIETLPIEIKFFTRLIDLNISDNRLRMLPSTFSDLRSLRVFRVANNNLRQLPAFKRDDIRLKHLDVSHNPLDGASVGANTFEVYPSMIDDDDNDNGGYNESLFSPFSEKLKKKFPTLFELSMLKIVRCDRLLKLASEESLPRTVVATMQRDIFKCYKCSQMCILPAYNSTDILDYVDHVDRLDSTGNYRHGMTFMKLLCRSCFDNMSS